MAEEHDTDKAEDHDSDKEEEESSEEESEDEEEQEEDVKAQFERIIAGFRDGKLDISTITSKPDEYNYLDQKTNDHNPRNLLHMIAEAGKDTTRALKPLVEHLVKHHRRLMEEKDNSGTTPLQAAIMAGIAKLVDYMCNAYDAEGDVDVVLALQDSKNNNCLHKAMLSKHKYARKIALKLIERVRDRETLRAQNNDGKTPLHIAVEWDRCTESQMGVVRALVAACDAALDVNVGTDVDPAQLSVYRYHEKTRKEAKKADAAKEKKEEQRSSRESVEGPTSSRNAKESSKSVPGGGPKLAPDQSRAAPTDQLSRSKEQPPSRYKDAPRERQELPMRGIQRQPTRMDMSAPRSAHPDGSKLAGKTAGTVSPALPKAPGGADTSRRSSKKKEAVTEATANEIRDFLKLHYMGTREDHESIVSFLYGPVQEKELYWSLADGPPVISLQRLERMKYVNFEDTLKYVLLPSVRVAKPPAATSKFLAKPAAKDVGKGRDDYTVIFDWLRRKGVKRIFNLYIDDREEPSHSDETIEKALQGIEVLKVWDWQRSDLSSEVIAKAAPNVSQVNLYWGGNNAVLRSWSESEGLNQLKKLDTVVLRLLIESIESKQSKDAKDQERPPPAINVQIERDVLPLKKAEAGEGAAASQEQHKDQHKWLTCMDDFATFVQNVDLDTSRLNGLEPKPITVALIDDGFDINEQSVVDKVVGGRSFRNQNNLNAPYWATSGFHGTVMASLICRVCPKVQLYVLRLDEHSAGEQGKRQITAKSAEKAVRAAIDRGVDIISMSWTIEKTVDNEPDIKKLETALDEAAKKNILLFCSANDQGTDADESHPSANPGRFKIGAATAWGTAWRWTRASHVDFIFPGDKVIKERPGNVPVEKCSLVSGSSVATALAAGLAALVLYCVQFAALHCVATNQQAKVVTLEDFQAMKTRERMAEAFHAIYTTKDSDNKYIEVWNTFETAPREGEGKEKDVKREIIVAVADKLKARRKLVFGAQNLL
ncbi:uncharacterized protein LTHEOB_4667 [Lasiodiplodia theobromae]|uniref:uncharacterized protein n=1 Tax=Lasiodiplodia theobromae TaxID=45133 RepID=UPI0015C37D79|nr:uncharacterized protein LTHEOB_4667 [Lasiodiplodia theobromae]KAF4546015.1 hypothetical protein LTHEOB_4667 [Lasiodiplodia theobromae]